MASTPELLGEKHMLINKNSAYTSLGPVRYDTLLIDFPGEFINSINEKTITLENIRCLDLQNEKDYFGASAYSDLIQDNHYADFFFSFTDTPILIPRTLTIYDAKTKFSIWFRDAHRELIDLDPEQTRVVIELLLEF
jgi:hypothetical protein